VSCVRQKEESLSRLIFVSIGSMCTYDTSGIAQLSLRTYLEYNSDNYLKIAFGNRKYYRDKNAPPFSLDRFYKYECTDSLRQLINYFLANKTYNDEYISSGEGLWYVLIYSTNDSIKEIIYKPDSLPSGLNVLHSSLSRVIGSRDLIPVNNFTVDSLFEDFQLRFFKKYPPLPPPSEIEVIMK
jgi:hypothetical protein